ncbi:MAG: hypothetical protein ACLU30_14170 [Odoribacter splanchnicus]
MNSTLLTEQTCQLVCRSLKQAFPARSGWATRQTDLYRCEEQARMVEGELESLILSIHQKMEEFICAQGEY